DRQLSGHMRSKAPNYMPTNAFNNEQTDINRADLLFDLMFHESEATSTSAAPIASNALHRLDLTGLLALDRPMLVAQVQRTPSRLVIDNATSAPKIDQTTLLRVILPLKKK